MNKNLLRLLKKSTIRNTDKSQDEVNRQQSVIETVTDHPVIENGVNTIENENENDKLDGKEGKEEIQIENLKNNAFVDLPKFCKYLEIIILDANLVLQSAYVDESSRNLKNRLERNVKELIALQREIQAINDNIVSLKTQIEAVRLNKRSHKRKLRYIKSKEQRVKIKLINERNRVDEPTRKSRRENSPVSSTSQSRQLGQTEIVPWIPQPSFAETEYVNSNIRQRSVVGPRRNKYGTQKVEIQQEPSEEGVTIYLTEVEPRQHRSDPNVSGGNTSTTTTNTTVGWAWPD